MAYFALLWKARTIEKCRLKYEKEKHKSLLTSSHTQPKTWSKKLDDYRYDLQKRISNTFKRLYPEGSAKSIFFTYLRTDQTFPNFVLKSVLGFAGGIILTYICFIFFVFQLSISLLHATVMSSIIGVLLTLGLAFSYRIRCLVFLLIPQFFSRVGRYSLTCYALVLILTGPATNTLKNSEVLSESMACRQEQIKTSVSQISDAMKKPLNAMKDCLGLMMERLNLVAAKMKKSVVIMHRLVMSVESLIKLSLSWLEATAMHVNKILKTPYARCAQVLEDGVESCKKNLGPDFWACSVPFVTEASCSGVRQYKAFCSLTGYVDGVLATVKRKLNTFEERVRSLFFVEVHIHHSYSFSSNASRSASQVAAGIVTEIRNRADPLLTWLSWSSCVTSLFLLLIIFRAKYYQHMYETQSRFDNRYITKELRELDLERQRQGRETVLPLNRRERAKYVTTTSFRLVSSEKVHLSRSAVFMVITTLKLLIHMIADYSLYWVLMTIRYHGRFQSAVPGIQHAGVQVSGKGFVAGLLRSLVGTLDIPLKASTLPPASCLPLPYPPDFRRYKQIGILICLLWFFALFEPYGLRLRHIIMRHYRPERAKARAVWLYNHFFRTQASFMKLSRRKLHREYMYNSEAKHTFRRWLNERLHCRWLQVLLGTAEIPHCLLCSTTGNTTDDDKKLIRCKTPNCPGVYCASCYSDIGQLCTICLTPKDYGDCSDDSLEKGSSDDESDSQEDTAPTRPGVSGTSIEKDNYHSNKDSGRKNKTQLLNKKDAKHSLETPLVKQITYQLSHVTSTSHRLDTLQPNTSERNKINILRNNMRSHISNLTEKSKPDKDSKITSSNTKNTKKYYDTITKISYCQNRTRNIFPGYRLLNRFKIFITPKKRKRKPIRIRISFNSITLTQQYVFLRRKILLNSSLQKLKKRCKRTEATETNQTTNVTASGNINRRKRIPKPRKVKRRVFMDTNTFANNNLKTIPQHKVISCSHIISIGKNAELNAVDLGNKNNKIEKQNEKENQEENNQQPKKKKGLKLSKHDKPDSKDTDANKKTDSHQSFEKLSKQWFKYWKNLKINVLPCADCMTSDAICTDENKTFKRRKKEKVLGKKSCECKPCPEREAIKNARNYRISTYLAEQIWGTNDKGIVDRNKSESAISSALKKLKWQTKEVKKADSLAGTKILKNCVVNLQWDRKPNVKGCICDQDSCQCLENPSAILEEKSLAKKGPEKTAMKRFQQRVRRQTKPTGKLLPTLVSSVSVAQEMTADDRLNLSNSITKRLGYYQAFGIKDFDEQSIGYGDYAQEDNKYIQHKDECFKSHKTDVTAHNNENNLHSDGHVQASNKDQAGPSMRIKAEKEDHRDIDVTSQEQAKCHYQRRGPLTLLKQLCSTIFATSSDEIKSNLEKQDQHINSASKSVLANPKTETCGCQYSTEKNHSQDQCVQVRTLKSVDNMRDKTQKCLCDAGISAVNKTCTCATQNFKIKNDGTLKLFKGQTICHRNQHGKRRCKSSERSYTKFEENLARHKKHTPSAPTSPGNDGEIRRTIHRSLSSSISRSLSSILSDETRTDTTVCSVATVDCRGRSKGHRLRVTVVTKTNQATLTDRKKVCDVGTFIDDWWSPLVEKRHKEISLEKKKGGHALQEKEERRRHVQRERNERHNIYKHSTGVATDRKLVTFRSKAQIIPTKTMDILSPSRYLLESQKYYNELFSSKLYAPQVFPVAQLMTPPKVERNHQTVENRHGNRRSSKLKGVDETSSPIRQSSPNRRNPSWTTESVKKQISCKHNKHRNRSSVNGVKKSKIKQRLNEGRDRD